MFFHSTVRSFSVIHYLSSKLSYVRIYIQNGADGRSSVVIEIGTEPKCLDYLNYISNGDGGDTYYMTLDAGCLRAFIARAARIFSDAISVSLMRRVIMMFHKQFIHSD